MPTGINANPSSEYDVQQPYLQSFVYGTGVGQAVSFTIQSNNPSQLWVFKQLGVENDNPASGNTTVALYLNGVMVAPSAYLTPTTGSVGAVGGALGTSAAGLPYLVLQSSDQLIVSVAGATAGDQIKVLGLYTEVPI